LLRAINEADTQDLSDMLKAEGLKDEEIDLGRSATWVMDEGGIRGFFSIRMEHNIPYLVHFCVKQGERCHELARRLVRYFKSVVRSLGFQKAIVNVKHENTYLQKLVSVYFKTAPYAQDNEVTFYLVEV
jgi:hypothetical protein